MKAKVVPVGEDEEIALPESLGDTDVEVVNGRNLAVVIDDTAPTQTYVRRFERDRNPKRADIQIPDSAVVAEWDGDGVTYLEEA